MNKPSRNAHLLLMCLIRINVNLTLTQFTFMSAFLLKNDFLVASELQDVEKKTYTEKASSCGEKRWGETGQFTVWNSGSTGKGLLISQRGLLIWASNKRKLPKICTNRSLPWETPALSLQQRPPSPEGQHLSLFHLSGPPETHLGHYPGGPRATGVGTSDLHEPTWLFGLQKKLLIGVSRHEVQRNHVGGEILATQQAGQWTGDKGYGYFPLLKGGTSNEANAGSAKNWTLPSFIYYLMLRQEQNLIQDLTAFCYGMKGPSCTRADLTAWEKAQTQCCV